MRLIGALIKISHTVADFGENQAKHMLMVMLLQVIYILTLDMAVE